jgi:hypothetical protein
MTPEITVRFWGDRKKIHYMIAIIGGGNYTVSETETPEARELRFSPKRRKRKEVKP